MKTGWKSGEAKDISLSFCFKIKYKNVKLKRYQLKVGF